jgi:GNAT superfamily N-acetyltransferase
VALPALDSSLRLLPLAETLDRVEALFEACRTGDVDLPEDLREWLWDELEHPNLSPEGSFVVLDGDRPVSLGFLTVDPKRRVAYNVLTATLPDFRRRNLALLVKLASARWAAEAGIERLLTENDSENAGMLAINDELGFAPYTVATEWVKRPA